ncbi:MAG: hypothetical protein H0W25_16250 [Acidimicrobiia bacterium]|nr:hypothetical protein [Acidimicrobiia bacterium]
MFSVHCPDHGCEVLLSERRIRGLVATPAGMRLDWECWCGHRGSLLTGRSTVPATAAMVGQHRPAV